MFLHKIINKLKGKPTSACQPKTPIENTDNFYADADMIKLGTDYGGWFIPKNFSLNKNDVCYFCGAGEDISFDCAVAKAFPCQIHIFDPTPRAINHFENLSVAITAKQNFPVNNSKTDFYTINTTQLAQLHFHPWGVFNTDEILKFFLPKNPEHVSCSIKNLQNTPEYFEAQCYTFATILQNLQHSKISIIKMDIEGAEYGAIDSIIKTNCMPDLLLIEFDELHTQIDEHYLSRINQSIEKILQMGMKYIYKQGSNLTFAK